MEAIERCKHLCGWRRDSAGSCRWKRAAPRPCCPAMPAARSWRCLRTSGAVPAAAAAHPRKSTCHGFAFHSHSTHGGESFPNASPVMDSHSIANPWSIYFPMYRCYLALFNPGFLRVGFKLGMHSGTAGGVTRAHNCWINVGLSQTSVSDRSRPWHNRAQMQA